MSLASPIVVVPNLFSLGYGNPEVGYALERLIPKLCFIPPHTTEPQDDREHQRDAYFVTEEYFNELNDHNRDFLVTHQVFKFKEAQYGISKALIAQAHASGKIPLLVIRPESAKFLVAEHDEMVKFISVHKLNLANPDDLPKLAERIDLELQPQLF